MSVHAQWCSCFHTEQEKKAREWTEKMSVCALNFHVVEPSTPLMLWKM